MSIYKALQVLSTITVKNNLPVNIVPADLFLFEDDLVKQLPNVYINYLKNCKVTPHGIVFKKFKIFNQFLIWAKHKKEFNLFYLIRNYLFRRKIKLDKNKKYIVCFDYWSMGYFHWMCDFLPKLIMLDVHLHDYLLILPDNHRHDYILDSLKIFDIYKPVRFSDKQYLSIPNALIPDSICHSGDNNPFVMQKLRDKFLSYYLPKTDSNVLSQNIYVSRSRAKGRFIENENEVREVVESLGFKIVHFEDYSLKEQIELMFNCKNLIGIHGANLTNLMFMNPKSNILELRKKDDCKSNYYYSLASSFNLNYFYLQCDAVKGYSKTALNLIVNIQKFKSEALKMLNT
jgi:hypothetical protein